MKAVQETKQTFQITRSVKKDMLKGYKYTLYLNLDTGSRGYIGIHVDVYDSGQHTTSIEASCFSDFSSKVTLWSMPPKVIEEALRSINDSILELDNEEK